jgi:hypothetical protein
MVDSQTANEMAVSSQLSAISSQLPGGICLFSAATKEAES